MRNLLQLFAIAILLLSGIAGTMPTLAQETDPWVGYNDDLFQEMDFDQNLNTPALTSARERTAIKKYMGKVAQKFIDKNYTVETDRNGEVVVIVLPTDDLFLPNDTLLWDRGVSKMAPIIEELKHNPGMYKLVMALHTDDTGSEIYKQWLSRQRIVSVFDWFDENVPEDQVMIPFDFADADPSMPNTTRAGRAANRRLELFLIPGPEMILRARKNKL